MKNFCFALFIILFQIGFSQQNLQWNGYFSYNKISDITESSNKFFAAAENSVFSKNLATNEIIETNTIDGLSGETISAIYFSETYNKTIIGYQNGLMIVLDNQTGSVLNVVDIINKSIPANIKRVNHFMEYDGILYVSCDFGIVQYNLATLNFGDTYYIGPNGLEIKVFQTTIYNDEIYAVTQLYGIKKASITNPNLIDFNQWQDFNNGYWNGIVTFNNQLIATNTNNTVHKFNGSVSEEIFPINQTGLDTRVFNNYLIITTSNQVFVYNSSLTQIAYIQSSQVSSIPLSFNCATVINEKVYIGTNENGVISAPLSNLSEFEIIMPEGPTRNNIFSIHTNSSSLWAVYGGYDISYNPYTFLNFTLTTFGISKFSENQWLNIPYEEVLEAKALTRITSNPSDESQVYISSYNNGLLKLEADIPTTLFNESNSSLKSLDLNSTNNIRIGPATFDRNGNLWVTNSRVSNGLNVLKSNGQWQAYNMSSIIGNINNSDFGRIAIDNSGTKWMATWQDGVIAFNENSNIYKKITDGADTGNLPVYDVRALAIDNRSQVWIGTTKGLRVISSTGSFNNENQITANPIIILEDGLAQELLYEQFITDIVVDGSNRKWIATADSGAFLFSSNGQQTIYHFTKDNSPLPSNVVNDIAINETTGEIFFATDKGMISLKGIATKPADDLQNVYVYPNPVRPGYIGTIKIAQLVEKANIKITDIEGNLVYETTSTGGTIEWDGTAFGKYKVASGVYMIFVSSEDGSDTTVKKVMIIR
ncbi:type IX secretion system anionic LPS delivery protein PorZ [Flavobacterium capsici]|uniref:T9SS type A sorting domain-containing protein n=1 Tax=Flavobacterium capsici TaxID=3075618 RepID=A0AA96EWJ7_9FLAO|nr:MULTISPECIES: T9SS type A sorting domain-containing protein [unclassified Flavobacterium]WNM19506.1 T9SS type A sorting domain-containing protein [Flavobacterium sp. PMR2A8]WNM20895.1 T9SS type A sorting domain-containing protein [Flavobacterium sp. PMTSA4]